MNYANIVWASTYKSKLEELYCHQKHAARIINFKDRFTHAQPVLDDMKPLNIVHINLFHIICFMFKCKKKIPPPIFHSLFTPKSENKYNIRSRGELTELLHRKKLPSLTLTIVVHIYEINSFMIISYAKFTAIIPQENQEIHIDVSWYRTIFLIFLILINPLSPHVSLFNSPKISLFRWV